MTDNSTFISSIFSKVKGEKDKTQNPFLRMIGNVKYKYTLFKAKDDGCYHKNYVGDFSYIDRPYNMTFHILDDNFGMFLYKVLKNKEFDFENTPDELKDIKFIAVNKLEKVVFISFDLTETNQYILSDFHGDTRKVVNNLYNIFNWFEQNFVFEEKRLNINYKIFFQTMFSDYSCFLVSLFKSFYISETAYELNQGELDKILDVLLVHFSEAISPSLANIRRNIEINTKIFYQFANQGIYMKELDSDSCLDCLPGALRGNILNYIIDDCYYDNLKDVFKNENKSIENDQNFVFNQYLFMEGMRVQEENSNLIIYESKEDKKFDYIPTFIKIKDEAQFEEFDQNVSMLLKDNLISNTSIIYSLEENKYYVCAYNDSSNQIKLCDYIKSMVNNQEEICNLLLMINDIFSSKAVIKQKVFVKEAESYLENLYFDKQTGDIRFTSIADISFVKDKGYTSFYYPLCMMQIIENFLSYSNMTVNDLYKCKFVKVFSQSFISSVIDYLNTKEYKDKGMIGKLKGTLTKDEEGKLEFLENVDLADESLLQRISLNPSYKYMFPSVSVSVEKAKRGITNDKTTMHVALDDYMDFVLKRNELSLSKRLIDKLTDCPNTQNFLIPEKLIISKDVYDEKNYIIIGVIWSKSKLYKLSDLVENKEITTKNIYSTVICNIMSMYGRDNISIDKLNAGINSLLMDDNGNIVIDCNSYTSIKDVVNDQKGVNVYYTNTIRLIVNEYGDKLEKFTYFTYEQVFENLENYIYTWEEAFDKIKFCNEHDRLYLSGDMCEECEKLYVIAEEDVSLESLMSFCEGKYKYFRLNENTALGNGVYQTCSGILWNSRDDINKIAAANVKLGIENGLYEKFIALTPQKIVIQNYDGNRKVVGILLDNYDFANMVEINGFNYVQRLKVVLMLYKKILPCIEDGTFIAISGSIFSTIFMDKNHKGEFILPNLPLLDTHSTVCEIEELKKEGKEKTLKLFSEFLYNYLISDEGLKVEIKKNKPLLSKVLESIKECDFKEEYIRAYLDTKDAYCKIHGVHFASSDELCPECIAEGINAENAIILDKLYFDALKSKVADFEGGEANLYFNQEGTIDKIFKDEVNVSFKSKILGKALQKEKSFEKFNQEHGDIKFAAIDKLLYSFENGVLKLEGYRQEYIGNSFKISSFKDKSFAEEKGYSKKDIVEILIKVCKGIEFLHSIGGFIGDLNGGNILIKGKTVYFIDKDGMSFDDVKNCVYTNLYIYPPSAENKNITKEDDWYSLAIQAFYYLTYSHPFRGISDKISVPKDELERMKYGYSVLGNHGIKLPSVSIGWGLMSKQMIEFFLDTFEGEKRESMLEILQSYLKNLAKNEMQFKEVVRKRDVGFAITENVYIDTDGILYFKEEFKLELTRKYDYEKYVYVCDSYIAILADNQTAVVNDQTGDCYIINKSYEEIECVYDNAIYYTLDNDTTVYVDEIDLDTKQVSTHILKRKTQNAVWVMDTYNKDKFVLLEQNDIDNTYDIYCNTTKVYSFPQDEVYEEATAAIIHDEITNKWLVVVASSNMLKGFVINQNGDCSEFTLNMDTKIESGYAFYKNTVYFTSDKKIHMYSVSRNELKTIYSNIVSSKATIDRRDNKLIIANEKTTYMYEKS